jgi:hypothetical protein
VFPDDAGVADQVRSAWEQVGVVTASAPAPAQPSEPAPVDVVPTVPAERARKVAVRRSGGFTGVTRSGELDLEGDPQGPEVRQLLIQADLNRLTTSDPAPDRFIYTVALGDWELAVPEQDLTPELHQVVRIVLDGPGPDDLG